MYSPVFNRPIDINKTIEDSLLMTSHHILINNIKVVKQLNPRLPAACDNGLKLVFINIIKNACDAIGAGGGTIKVSTGIKIDVLKSSLRIRATAYRRKSRKDI